MSESDSAKVQRARSARVAMIRCDGKCYTKASASMNDVLRMRGGGGEERLIRGADSRNLHEGPLASLWFPIRVHRSGGGGLVYARCFP